jgi:hypothetical protein
MTTPRDREGFQPDVEPDVRTSMPTETPRPLWAQVGFAWLVALASLVLAATCLYLSAFYGWLTVAPPERLHPNRELAVLFTVLAIAFLVAAPALPILLRWKWNSRRKQAALKAML